MRLLLTGSRTWTNPEPIRRWLGVFARDGDLTVVHGGAHRGADYIANQWVGDYSCAGNPIRVERHPADWKGIGQRAGILRNIAMVKLGADLCLAFIAECEASKCTRTEPHGSHGATHCADLAEAAGIDTRRYTWLTSQPHPIGASA